MAKKSRRTRQQETTTPTAAANGIESPAPGVGQKTVDFIGEYAYVYKELVTIFIIAIVMFVVLFGLSYVVY
jgi:hypothetical protein